MIIQVNTDNHVQGSAGLSARVEADVTAALERFADRITRVEVHLKDVNSDKGGTRDHRCAIEARLAGLKPVAVDHAAPTTALALDGAMEKIARAVEHALGKAAKA